MQNNKKQFFVLFCMAMFFIACLVYLFVNLSNKGLNYPAYSSLSTEPAGLKAVYESFNKLSGQKVSRSFSEIINMQKTDSAMHVAAGLNLNLLQFMSENRFDKIDSILSKGAFLLMAFQDHNNSVAFGAKDSTKVNVLNKDTLDTTEVNENVSQKDSLSSSPDTLTSKKFSSVLKEWGLGIKSDSSFKKKGFNKETYQSYAYSSLKSMDDSIKWLSNWSFEILSEEWQTIYSKDSLPVIIARAYGDGHLLLSAGSYFLTNEALAFDVSPKLLHFIYKQKSMIIFHESQLGLIKDEGLIKTLSKFNLEGLFVGVLLMMLLYLWKNTFPLITLPAQKRKQEDGLDWKSNGFVHLMVNTFSKKDVIRECIAEWETGAFKNRVDTKKAFNDLNKVDQRLQKDMDEKSKENPNLVKRYNHLHEFLLRTQKTRLIKEK